MLGTIFNINRFAIHDGPGIRTTVFFQGCPLFCPWCHNPESQGKPEVQNDNNHHVRILSVSELLSEVERDLIFFDESGGGVTFSGGEPLLQEIFLAQALKIFREKGIHTAVDTCGMGGVNSVNTLSLADLILYDIKDLDADHLKRETGGNSQIIQENLTQLAELKKRIWLRLPLIPGLGIMRQGPATLCTWFEPRKHWFERVSLLPFHNTARNKYRKMNRDNALMTQPVLDQDAVEPYRKALCELNANVVIGG